MTEAAKKPATKAEAEKTSKIAIPNYAVGKTEVKVVDPKDKTEIVFSVENK